MSGKLIGWPLPSRGRLTKGMLIGLSRRELNEQGGNSRLLKGLNSFQ